MNNYIKNSFEEVSKICHMIDIDKIDRIVDSLVALRARKGRLFILGYGGSAGNADHMVNDLMKICGVHAIAPTNNVSLMTAWANDHDIQDYFYKVLRLMNCSDNDDICVLSTSGFTGENYRQSKGLLLAPVWLTEDENVNQVWGIIGNSKGKLVKRFPQTMIVIPEVNSEMMIPHAESMQAVIWHIMVNDPRLKQ